MRPQAKAATLIFVFALAIRLLVLAYFLPKLDPTRNVDWYHELSRNLLAGQGFVAVDPGGELLPQVDRVPVYPLFLAGLSVVGGDRLGWYLLVQCVLGAATCALTVILASRWLSRGAATLAGLLISLDPNSVVRGSDLRTETLFTLLLLIGACLLAWQAQRGWAWLVTGLLWSVAALCRPIAIGLWTVGVLVLVALRLPWRGALIFFVGFLPLLGLWTFRNWRITGHVFFSTAALYNLYSVRASGVAAEEAGVSHNRMQDEFGSRFRYVQFFKDRETFEQALRECRQVSREVMSSSPQVAAKQYVLGWAQVLFGPGQRGLYNWHREPLVRPHWWPKLYALALVALAVLAAWGAWRLGRPAILLSALVAYFVLLSGGGGGNSRFRLPFTPMMMTLAAAAVLARPRGETSRLSTNRAAVN